jgi:hypothetical protein
MDAAEDSSSTLIRLFDSVHVKDLRLIAGVALAAGLYGSIVVFASSLESGVMDALLPKGSGGGAGHTAAQPHVLSIVHGVLVGLGDFLKTSAAALGLIAAVIAWAYQRGSARLGVVDLFACEISTLCRVATVVDSAKRYVDEYSQGWMDPEDRAGGAPASAHPASSTEDYFPIFGSNSRDLQSLEARVVINITAFYTYMKAVRDMRRGLQAITPLPSDRNADRHDEPQPGSWREAMRNLIYMLFLALESAHKTIHDLVEFEPEQAERIIVILISELEAYGFLCSHYTLESDIRRKRLLLRRSGYEEETRDCIEKVEAGMKAGDPRERRLWEPAARLLDELCARLEEALRQASDDPAPLPADAAA